MGHGVFFTRLRVSNSSFSHSRDITAAPLVTWRGHWQRPLSSAVLFYFKHRFYFQRPIVQEVCTLSDLHGSWSQAYCVLPPSTCLRVYRLQGSAFPLLVDLREMLVSRAIVQTIVHASEKRNASRMHDLSRPADHLPSHQGRWLHTYARPYII